MGACVERPGVCGPDSLSEWQVAAMRRRGFTLIELLVVIAIM